MIKLSLHQYFQSSMILQRDEPITVKGQAEIGSEVTLRLERGDTKETIALTHAATDLRGQWSAVLAGQTAGGPYELFVLSGAQSLHLTDIYFGDVFVLAGQSNMELPLARCQEQLADRFAAFEDNLIREMKPPMQPVFGDEARDWPEGGQWLAAVAPNLDGMSALGLSFARLYRESVAVPVGLLMLAVGGSPIESWLPLACLEDEAMWVDIETRFRDQRYVDTLVAQEQSQIARWYEQLADETPPEGAWETFTFPRNFMHTPLEDYSGTIWLRHRFSLNEDELKIFDGSMLRLGSMIDADHSYLNGSLVGETGYRYPPRRYTVPQGLLRVGENELLIRLMVHQGRGGIVEGPFYGLRAGPAELDLSGQWAYSMGIAMEAMPPTTTFHYLPSGLYQSQLTPLRDFSIAGSLWYQGESNDSRPHTYEKRFRQLIAEWKKMFGEGKPFVFVQLSAYTDPSERIAADAWAKIREAQRRVADTPGTAMVVSVDCGEKEDLHPQDKWTIGLRADLAMRGLMGRLASGEVSAGPEICDVFFHDNGTVEVLFSNAENGLELPDQLRDAIRVYRSIDDSWLKAEFIDVPGNRLIVNGEAIRFNYESSPIDSQIRNHAGLPASPFELLPHR